MFTVSQVFQTNPAKSYSLSKPSHFWQQFLRMGTRHEPPHPFSLTLFAYKKAHYLCKLLLNVQLPNCGSAHLDMYSSPAVMQVQFWNWFFKVKLLYSHFWPLKMWLHTREWRVCNKIFVQHLGTWQSKFYRKMCDCFQFSKLEGLGKICLFYMHFIMKKPDTNLVWQTYHGQPLSFNTLRKNIMYPIYTYLGSFKICARK